MERQSCVASNFRTYTRSARTTRGNGSCPGQPLHAYLVVHTNVLVVPYARATNLRNSPYRIFVCVSLFICVRSGHGMRIVKMNSHCHVSMLLNSPELYPSHQHHMATKFVPCC